MPKDGSERKGPPRRKIDRESDFEDSMTSPMPVSGLTPMGAAKPNPSPAPRASVPPPATGRNTPATPPKHSGFQKGLLRSGFDRNGAAIQSAGAALGRAPADTPDDDDETTELGRHYDGLHPADGLTSRDLFRAIEAPVQSREGRRSAALYAQVINQFAVGHNPRYQPDGPGRFRAHVFIWDLSRAMNVEVPHFLGTKELSLAQTCDWIRDEGPVRGWFRTKAQEAMAAAAGGKPVLVMPRDQTIKLVGVLRPESLKKNEPLVAAAGMRSGNDLSPQTALGQLSADYFFHA